MDKKVRMRPSEEKGRHEIAIVYFFFTSGQKCMRELVQYFGGFDMCLYILLCASLSLARSSSAFNTFYVLFSFIRSTIEH